ncbi:LysR family transcriptional regulator [Paenibacillus sp. NFR01]|uniref:LysR family transcriptional regulator n=1 Tax=Paenibacillus sp. NFR01 TaxID=1566279 RepID=UPI0008B7F305|nr:LysR family transcriptional regulator [Paenibacillus sp. NFR01]SET14874.1 DNA-binding transcriptional regulator, LysR family [Paenibacillus sp. NFR01]
MDLKAITTFHKIVACGSFNRAAQELNYAQSTVTMQIQKLENELGLQLLERGKELKLTEAGRLFYEQSIGIADHVERLRTRISDFSSGEAGHVRLGVTEPTASFRLPELLRVFSDRYPKVQLSLEISSTPVLAEHILRGELDMAVATAPDLGGEIMFEGLFREHFVLLLPAGHPLAERATVEPEDLNGHRLLITSATCPYRRKLEAVLKDRGVSVETMEIGSMSALQFYVEKGFGIALAPLLMLKDLPGGMTTRPIGGSLIHMTMGLLSRSSAVPLQGAARRLYAFLQEEWGADQPVT